MALFTYSSGMASRTRETPPLAAFDRLADYFLEQGEFAQRQLRRPNAGDAALRRLQEEGYLEQDGQEGLRVSGRGMRRIEELALRELFSAARPDGFGRRLSRGRGAGGTPGDEDRPYVPGDAAADVNLHATLKNALRRNGPGLPVNLTNADLVVYDGEPAARCAAVLLLDMSGSMARYGKFTFAKKVALGLRALIRRRFPEDRLDVVGFATWAVPLVGSALLHAAPRSVSLFDGRASLRLSPEQAARAAPQHFTNIQAGLRRARQLLRPQSGRNKQILCVTDGEPTAHLEGRDLVLDYPPTERTALCTLAEVRRCVREGIGLSVFGLIEDPFVGGVRNFVDRMARAGRGPAVACTAGRLGPCVLERFVNGRRSRTQIG